VITGSPGKLNGIELSSPYLHTHQSLTNQFLPSTRP